MPEKVSIITPLHNSGAFISETIDSVLAQTYTHWEMLIVDDSSVDDGPDLVRDYQKMDDRIKLLHNNKKSGPAITRNKAIEAASGRYIAFLDSDDLWLPRKLELQVDFMMKNNYSFTFTGYEKITESGIKIGKINVPKIVSYHDLLKTCSVGCLTAMYDTGKIGKIYMPLIDKRQDYALWLKILKIIPEGHGLNLLLSQYRVRGGSISSNKWNASKYQWKVYRDIEKLNYLRSAYYFSLYTFHGIIKTYFK